MINLVEHMPFVQAMGLEIVEANKDRVVGEVTVTRELCTTGHIMHGGAVMTVADTLGAIGAFLNLPDGAKTTTTTESKTNFIGAAPEGVRLTAETTPIHVGRRTSVWQTRITRDNGKLVAVVTQSVAHPLHSVQETHHLAAAQLG